MPRRDSTTLLPPNTEGSFCARLYLRIVGKPIITSKFVLITLKFKQGKTSKFLFNSLQNKKLHETTLLEVIDILVLAKILVLISLLLKASNIQVCVPGSCFWLFLIQAATFSLQ